MDGDEKQYLSASSYLMFCIFSQFGFIICRETSLTMCSATSLAWGSISYPMCCLKSIGSTHNQFCLPQRATFFFFFHCARLAMTLRRFPSPSAIIEQNSWCPIKRTFAKTKLCGFCCVWVCVCVCVRVCVRLCI